MNPDYPFELSNAIPQLPSGNVEKTAQFYATDLGFEVIALFKDFNFLIVRRGSAEIHFWQTQDENAARQIASSSSCYIRVKNITSFFDDLKKKGTKFRYELQEMPWGMNEFQVDDLYGNAIKFGETTH